VQDGATPHTTDANIEEITRHCFLCPSWPANSPDLNPIEMVWSIIKNDLNWSGIHSRKQAIDEIINIWKAIPQITIDRLCNSFPTRVAMMREARGETTQPLLSSNRTTVPAGYLSDRQHVVALEPWTVDHDEDLIRRRAEQPRMTWETLVHFYPGRTPVFLKNRWKIARTQMLNNQNDEARNWEVLQLFLGLA
jgi:hypothetical protein